MHISCDMHIYTNDSLVCCSVTRFLCHATLIDIRFIGHIPCKFSLDGYMQTKLHAEKTEPPSQEYMLCSCSVKDHTID